MKTYPRGFMSLLHGTLLTLLGSGLLLAPGALQMRLEWDMPWVLSSGLRVWVAALHALSFLLMFALVGALWTVHIRTGWVRRENLTSGALLLLAFALLGLSGLALYYAGGERLPVWSAVLHLLAGGALPALYVVHRLGARAAAARAWPLRCRVQATACASTARTAPSASQTVSTRP